MLRRQPSRLLLVVLPALLLAGCDRQGPADSFSVQVQVETEQGEPIEGASVGVRPCYTLGGQTVCGSDEVFSRAQRAAAVQQSVSVDLASWLVEPDGSAALLRWTTASETENSGFRIECKTDDNSFAEIDFVEGAGTTDDSTDYSYRDESVQGGARYTYRLIAVATSGDTSVVGNPQSVRIPLQPAIAPISPNPFRTRTTLRVQVGTTSTLRSTVHTLDGAEVRTIVDGTVSRGVYQLRWQAGGLPDGLYEHRTRLQVDGEIVARDTTFAALARDTPNGASLGTTAANGRVSTTIRVRFPSLFDVPRFVARDAAGNAIGKMRVTSIVQFVVTTSEAQYTYRRSIEDGKNTFTFTVPP